MTTNKDQEEEAAVPVQTSRFQRKNLEKLLGIREIYISGAYAVIKKMVTLFCGHRPVNMWT